jgi:hypothetical protein
MVWKAQGCIKQYDKPKAEHPYAPESVLSVQRREAFLPLMSHPSSVMIFHECIYPLPFSETVQKNFS